MRRVTPVVDHFCTSEVAEILSLDPQTVRSLRRKGALPADIMTRAGYLWRRRVIVEFAKRRLELTRAEEAARAASVARAAADPSRSRALKRRRTEPEPDQAA